MTLAEILAALMSHEDRKAAIKGLQEMAHPIYQAVFDTGHAIATADKQKEIDRLSGELATAKHQFDELKERSADKGEPATWQKEKTDLTTRVTELELEVKDAKKEGKEALKTERHRRAVSDFRTKLIGLRVDPIIADALAEKKDIQERIRHKEDGSVEVLQAGKTIPYAASDDDGKTPLDLLADEVFAKIDKKFVAANADRGSGQQNGGEGAGGGQSFLKTLKGDLEKKRTEQQKDSISTLDDRLRRHAPAP